MTYDEKETLMGFLRGAFPRLTTEQEETYGAMLMSEDVENASKAILTGVNDWKYPPSWAEIKERIRSLDRRPGAVPKEAPPQEVPEEIADYRIPEWGREWIYARYFRDPPDSRPFRESYPADVEAGNEPAEGWMPTHLYREEAKAVTDAKVRAVISSGVDIMSLLGDT
jgi:hypothetical protein